MKTHYTLAFLLFMSFSAFSQSYVEIAASSDPTSPTDIFPIIMGDTTSTGERNDPNTIYQLQNGQVYITSGRIANKPDWDLQIEALDLTDTDNKAILTRIPNASGNYSDIMFPQGNVSIKNLWIISGEKGPLENHDWGKIRILGENARVIVDNCIIEKDRGGFLQIRANGVKIYMTNSELRNGGNRRIFQGNGRGIDARNFALDTLIMKNTIVHNIQDRFLRSQGAFEPHNYIEIDHCTSFNTLGRHGFIQLGRVIKAKITNNLFINPIMMGSSIAYTDEQSQPDNDLHKVITIDTLYENTSLTISNNNIFWDQEVMDFWDSNDTVSAPGVLSDLIVENLGSNLEDAYFQEPLTLNSIPVSILPYVEDIYADPNGQDMFDLIVEDIAVSGLPNDSGNLFDFSSFEPCYDATTESATAGTGGGAIGAVFYCSGLTDVVDFDANQTLALQVFPNPTSGNFNATFELHQSSDVNILLRDMSGKLLSRITESKLFAGKHAYSPNLANQLNQGIYFLSVQSEQGIMTQKIVVH